MRSIWWLLAFGFALGYSAAYGSTQNNMVSDSIPVKKESLAKKWHIKANGYVKFLHTASFVNLNGMVTDNFIHNRINLKAKPTKNLKVVAEFRNRIFYGQQTQLTQPNFGNALEADAGLIDMNFAYVNQPSLIAHTAIDRLYLDYTFKKFQVTAGRQRINWGINTVWNPNDLFNTFNYTDFDYEERPGSDAIRLQYYMGTASKIEFAASEKVAAALVKLNKWNYDFQFIGARYYDAAIAGIGWAGNLKNAGFKGEASYLIPVQNNTFTEPQFSASLGVDYTFKNNMYWQVGGLYNMHGSNNIGQLLLQQNTTQTLSPLNLMPNKYSVFIAENSTIGALSSVGASVIWATDLNLVFLMPSYTYSIKQNLDFMLVGQLYAGYKPTLTSFGNSIFARLKWSF